MFLQDLLTFDDLRENSYIKENIIWDLDPKHLMEPRCTITDEGTKFRDRVNGYVFYIDTLSKKPTLYLMKHSKNDFGSTLAIINEIPEELITEAIIEQKGKEYFGMYPINSKIKDWILKEMGISN